MDLVIDAPLQDQEQKVFSWPVRVYYEDTDCGGVVYHANYLRFLERARSEWLRALGFDHRLLARSHGISFVVRSIDLKYLQPASLDDLVHLTVRPLRLGRSLMLVEQTVERDAVVLVRARIGIACLGAGGFKPVPIPDPLRQSIRSGRWK